MNLKQSTYITSLYGDDSDLGFIEFIDIQPRSDGIIELTLYRKDANNDLEFADYFIIDKDAIPQR